MLIIQISLFVVLAVEITILFFCRSQRILQKSLHLLTFFFCCTSFSLFFSASAAIRYFGMNSGEWTGLVGKIGSLGNLCLGVFLCFLYKAVAHSYSAMAPNCLCPRYDTASTIQDVVRKILSCLIVIFLKIKILWPQ